NYALRRPVGVAGLISPWNLPLLLLTWKVAPCLAAGNTCVIKPAELTPMTATKLAEVCKEAGLPDGVLNVVHGFGPDAAGQFLTEHPDVNLISLTGETTTGKAVMRSAAGTLKRLSFELGGKNPNIIFADADLDDCIETTLRSSFANQGEVCLCGSRIYVERPLYETFVQKLVERASQLVVGDPLDPKTNVGALISQEHLERVEGFVQRAVKEGGRILTGGKRPSHMNRGYFFEPTVIVDVDSCCEIVRQEVFGPVVTVQPFDTEEEVIRAANDTHYGLSATIWTSNLKRAHRVAGEIEAETFSADLALITITGANIHPAIAKGRMINAVRLAAKFLERLPQLHYLPETTSDREGFIHPYVIEGGVAQVTIRCLLRDFETPQLAEYAGWLREIGRQIERDHPGARVQVAIQPQYRNMRDGIAREPRAVAYAVEAVRRAGLEPKLKSIRGGTDGALLTAKGLPTPNLSCGEHNFHSPLEWTCLEEMESAVHVVLELCQVWAGH
ncbi:MAG: aldehyde dehydrogenase family protein, partial [Alicyclobacillus sp.]|nr:aldehyde dehydrogenase family protein [Alicyclobacillus sp.]